MLQNGSEHVRIEVSDLVNGGSLKKYGLLSRVVPPEENEGIAEVSKHSTNIEKAIIILAIVSMIIGIGCISAYADYENRKGERFRATTTDELNQRPALLICASVFGSIGLGIIAVVYIRHFYRKYKN